ncbi:hypothetical protein [Paenibacillus taiwanensis]|uniref:hypothetical protein n=1 Tax=Paenibacillus taiwanensis TaxID=401638 RepID=UPI00040CF6CE|nr:hypothetical protein [Paenibacillus taiwanensis]
MKEKTFQISRLIISCLMIVVFLAACSQESSNKGKAISELDKVKDVTVSFFNAMQNYSDYDTYMRLSEDERFESIDERAKVMKGAFSEPDKYEMLTSYVVQKYTPISQTEYHAVVSQTFKDVGEAPAYAFPVVKKGDKWVVVIERIQLLTSSI